MRLQIRHHQEAQEAQRRDRSFVAFLTSRGRVAHLTPETALMVKQKITELLELFANLDESDPDARADGTHVRVSLSVTMLPSIPESRKVQAED